MTVAQTSEFKKLIETYGKQISLKVGIYQPDGTLYKEFEPREIRSAKLHFDGQLFTAVMRCFDMTLEGDYRAISKGYFVYPSFTVTDSITEQTVNYGRFEIAENSEYDEDANTTAFICYDAMYSTVKPFTLTADELINALTLSGLLTVVAEKCGFDINNIDDLKNADRAVDPAVYLISGNDSGVEYTFRDVLDETARCAGCSFCFKSDANGNVCLSDSGKPSLYIVYVTDGNGNMKHLKDENGADILLDISNFKSLRINEQYGKVNSVIFSRQPQEDNVVRYASGADESTAVSVKLKQPEMADSDDDSVRVAWLEDILTAVNGLKYYCVDFESYGIGYLNFGDVFTIKAYKRDSDGNYEYGRAEGFKTVFMRSEMIIDTDVKESVKLEMPEATSTDYSAATTAEQKAIRQTFLRVDKKIGEIRGLITDPENGLQTQLSVTAQNATAALSKVSSLEDAGYITTVEAKSLITAEADKISLYVTESIKGGTTNILLNSECFEDNTIIMYNASLLPLNPQYSHMTHSVPSGKHMTVEIKTTAKDTMTGFYFMPTDLIGQDIGSINKIKLNTQYTLSFWARTNETSPYILSQAYLVNPGDGTSVDYDSLKSTNLVITDKWTKYVAVFKITSGEISTFSLRFYVNTADDIGTSRNISISSFKLEEGDTATKWTPNVVDVEKSTEARLSVYVKKDDYNSANIVSYIEAYADVIDLSANTLIFNQGKFALDKNGYITSTGGTIGGWTIDKTCLYSDYGDYRAYLQTPTASNQWVFSTQTKNSDGTYKGTFLVKADGTVHTNVIRDLSGGSMAACNTNGEYVYGYGAYDSNINTRYWGGGDYRLRTSGREIKVESAESGTARTNFRIGGTTWTVNNSTAYRDHIVSAGGLVISANDGKNAMYLDASTVYVDHLNVLADAAISSLNVSGTDGFKHKGTIIARLYSQSWFDVTGSGSVTKENWACFGSDNLKTQIRGAMVYANSVFVSKISAGSTQDIKTNISETQSVLNLFKSGNSTIYSYNYIPKSTANSSSDGKLSADSVDEIELEDNDTCYGFVIGDGYAVPDEVISASGDSINLYSMASINWKATQELYAALMNAQEKISELKNQINGGN